MSKSRILETKFYDIIDFNTTSPEPFIEASKEILGEDNIYYMTAFGTMQESEAFRNMCRAKGLQMNEYNDVAKDLDTYRNHSKWKDIIEESKVFVGVIDSVSPHPCAFLLLDKPISEELGLMRIGSGDKAELCAIIDSRTSDDWKYLKNDFLTVTVWKIIDETYKLLGKPIPTIRQLDKEIENNDEVWTMYEEGLTATLNQAGTDSGTPQVVRYKPKSVRELSAWVAAIRPSFQSMKDIFLDRKEFSYGIEAFDEILKESDNFVLYQEDIMKTLVYAGFTEDITYGLLKAISKKKKGIIEPIQEKFMNGFTKISGSEENTMRVWQIIEDAVEYGFNASHSLSVAYDSVYGANLKAKYPLEYYSTVLNIYENNTTTTSKIYRELSYFGINVIPIQFRKSRAKYSPDKANNQIVKGLKSIKFLNESIAEELFELGKGRMDSFLDLLIKIEEETSVNSRQMGI